jgi:DNA-binding NtrC family response regulator/tetratricopeptide (TPR) repeat protein
MSQTIAQELVAILIELRQIVDSGRNQDASTRIAELEATGFAFDNPIDDARFLSLKSTIQYRHADYGLALATALEGLALVITTGENSLIAELQSTAAQSLTELGRICEAERVYRDLVSTYRRLNDKVGVIRSLNRLSRVHFIKGQYDKAVECLLEAGDCADGLDDRKWQAMIKGNLGTILNLTGEFHTAVEFLSESAALNRLLDNRLNLCRAHLSLAYAQMHLLRFDDAEQNLATAETMVDGLEAEKISLNQYHASLALLRSNPAEALSYAQKALQRAQAVSPESASICQLGRIIAEAEYRLGNLKAAQESAGKALEVARTIDQKVEIGACQRVLAMVAHDLGESQKADDYFGEAVLQFSQLGARFDLAITYLAWSRTATDHTARSEYRLEATRIFSSLKLDRLYLRQPSRKSTNSADDITLIGNDPVFIDLVRQATVCADSDIPVLLLGETGSGKDQFARYIHHHSRSSKGPLIQVNCAAIPIELAESELFGFEKGAFTSASETKTGLIEAADHGTLFLNEIGELPQKLQAKLLAALEEKRFFRLGSTTARRVNFRLIAATNVDLAQAVHEGKFRADLYYRLAVMTLQVPRLAARSDDAFRLFKYFMEMEQIDTEGINPPLLVALQERCRRYDWPGNVRELKNYVELFSLTEHRDAEAICRRFVARLEPKVAETAQTIEPLSLPQELERFEKSKIHSALGSCGGVIRRAADFLGLPEATLRSKMKKYRMSAA